MILSSAVEQTGDPIVITNANGKIEYINSAFTDITGFVADEVIGRNPNLLKSGTHPPKYYKQMWDTILGGKTWYGTLVNRKKDGEIYFAESTISPIYSPEGSIVNFVSVEKDVTRRMKAEEKLADSEAELRALFASMTDAVLVLDADGRYVKIAPTNPVNLYRSPDEMLGKTVHEILPKEQADYIVAKTREAVQIDQIVTAEYALQIGGKEIWFSCNVTRLSENTALWV